MLLRVLPDEMKSRTIPSLSKTPTDFPFDRVAGKMNLAVERPREIPNQ